MSKLIPALFTLLIIATLTSCKKTEGILTSDRKTISTIINTPAVGIYVNDQKVKISITNKVTLNMSYYEDVTLFVSTDSLQNSFAVILNEDFKSSQLGNFNYTSVNGQGVITSNYVDNNLNNLTLKSRIDTVINKIPVTKMNLVRNFLFSNTYTNSQNANSEYTYLLNIKDTMGFSSYLKSGSGNSAVYTATANLIYSAN